MIQLKVKVDVTNKGKVAGKEIVQLYVRDVKSTFARPEKELKAFTKVEIKPGKTEDGHIYARSRSILVFRCGQKWLEYRSR